jgi:hypothetical protein
MIKNLTFKTSIFSGDIIYALAGIKHVCDQRLMKAELYLWLGRAWKDSVDGQSHPYGINQYAFDMMKPLVESQPYMAGMRLFNGEKVAVDLDDLRTLNITTMPHGSITRWPGMIWPDMQPDASKPWIELDDFKLGNSLDKFWKSHKYPEVSVFGDTIIINRTSRWRNPMIHYWFLRDYKDKLVFAGLPEEHQAFCKEWELDIPLLKVANFLELAIALRSCRYFIGNQSMCFALAEAMKIPRLLEVCPYAPNVIPCGEHGYDFLHQFALEWMVKDVESPFNKL